MLEDLLSEQDGLAPPLEPLQDQVHAVEPSRFFALVP